MKLSGLALVLAIAFLSAIPSSPASAQEKPGNVTLVTEMTPKPGSEKQFEAGLKQLSAWYESNNDPQGRVVFEQVTGEKAGTYSVVRRWMHWADLDKPVPSDQQARAEFDKALGDTVATFALKVYVEHPELDHSSMQSPAKYYELIILHVPVGKWDQFRALATQFREAVEETKAPTDYSWLSLDEGGESGTWILAIAHKDSASFGDPAIKPIPQVVKDAFGESAARNVRDEIASTTGGFWDTEVVTFRPDLSYFPKK